MPALLDLPTQPALASPKPNNTHLLVRTANDLITSFINVYDSIQLYLSKSRTPPINTLTARTHHPHYLFLWWPIVWSRRDATRNFAHLFVLTERRTCCALNRSVSYTYILCVCVRPSLFIIIVRRSSARIYNLLLSTFNRCLFGISFLSCCVAL